MKNLREGAHKTLQIPSLHMQLKERGEEGARRGIRGGMANSTPRKLRYHSFVDVVQSIDILIQ